MKTIGIIRTFGLCLSMCWTMSVWGQESVLEVNVTQSGELRSLVGHDLLTATSISVRGNIGAEDFATLRDMTYQGMLQSVDLTGATPIDAAVPDYAFYDDSQPADASQLRSISLPECESIGEYAFAYTPIESVTLPSSLREMGSGAFMNCANLCVTNKDFGQLTAIPDRCFKGCKGFYNRINSDGLKTIGVQAFMGCDLEKFDLAESITEVGEEAFARARIIDSVNNPPTIRIKGTPKLGSGVYKECTVYDLGFFNALECYPDNLAADMPDTYYLHLGQSQEDKAMEITIGENAFAGFLGPEIYLPEGVTEVGATAFRNSNIKRIYLPASVKSLGNQSFYTNVQMRGVVCAAIVPPAADNAFNPSQLNNCTLFVPIGCAMAYKQSPGWKNFSKYVETADLNYETLGTDNISADTFTVVTDTGSLTINSGGEAIGSYVIHSVDSRLIHSGNTSSSHLTLAVEPGAYIISVGLYTVKVVVR